MKALTLTLLVSLISAISFAGNVDMNGGSDSNQRTGSMTSLERLQQRLCENNPEFCGALETVAWYQDRDNSMSDANDDVGKAMAIIMGPTGTVTQAVQVCPGVYLATAHGALDSPIVARENNRPLQPIGPGSVRIIAYPMVRENIMRANTRNDYISPRLRNPSNWERGNENTDYVFIKVGNPLRPNSFVTPLSVTPEELVQNSPSLEVRMYRGKSKYRGAENGRLETELVHGQEQAIRNVSNDNTRALVQLFQSPQKVNSSCSVEGVLGYNNSYVSHNCPSEQGASGSSFTSRVNGESYLIGIHTMGSSNNIESSKDAGGSTMLTSSSFCSDYQTACGAPCPSLNDIRGGRGNSDQLLR